MIAFDRITQARDFEYFRLHPERWTYARLASEIEEIGARRLAGIDPERHDLTTVIVVRRTPGGRERAATFMPTQYGRPVLVPRDEAECARLFEGAE